MEKIIKLAQKNYDFGVQSHLLTPYFQDLSTKSENVEAICDYTIKELRAKKANSSLLFLLSAFVDKCPGSAFSQHGSNWVQLLIRNAADNQGNLSLILKILANIIHNIVINNCKKELDSKTIERVVDFCTQLSSRSSALESLKCLELVLKTYPEHCSFVSKSVNAYLLKLVDNPSREISRQVGICFLFLYQVKGGLCRGSTLEQSWMQLQNSLLANIYAALNGLLEEELFADSKLIAEPMTTVDNTTTTAKPVLCQRILNLTGYLDTALRMPLVIAKPIHAAKIVDLVYRLLEENSPLFSNRSLQRDITIGPYLHHMHQSCLALLRSLCIVLRSNALLFNKTICAVLRIALKRCSRHGSPPYQFEYRSQKIFVYELIQEWMAIVKSGKEIENVVQLTMDDVWAVLNGFEAVIKEKEDDKSSLLAVEKGSKKRRRSATAEPTEGNATKNVSHIVEACLIVSAALKCLDRILAIFGHSLSSNQHHAVLTNVHAFAKKLVDASMWGNPLWSDEYNLAASVCQVLITFNTSSHHMHRSSINYTLSLLEMIRSCEPQNRQLCLNFQNHLETVFHYPRAPVTLIHLSSMLLQEPEIAVKGSDVNEVEFADEEEDDDEVSVTVVADENEITSTVNGQVEKTEIPLEKSKDSTAMECIDIAEDDQDSAQSISSEEVDEADTAGNKEASVVDIGSEDEEESVVELHSPSKAKKPRLSESKEDPAIQAVDDIMSEFVNELV